ncbi:DUF3592 domain-containing protein [Flavobacterium rhizosphaerae]|uniref:DUF3592 domain-containing protein n=1 Tax=Flavobacterium rhizosphaerae TaxID=3163298 RepID=A0ABW8YYI6_9FLAO
MINEIIVFIISVPFIMVGNNLLLKRNYLKISGKKATAIIYKNNRKYGSDSDETYYPVVRFLTDKNEQITQELDCGTNPPRTLGKHIEVLYDPLNPNNVIENNTFNTIALPWLFIVLGTSGILITVLELLDITDIIH